MPQPAQCIVYLWLQDILGNDVGSGSKAVFSATIQDGFKYGQFVITPSNISSNFDINGYAQIQMVETETPGVYIEFGVSYSSGETTKQINFKPAIVPNSGAISLTSITDILR